MATGRGWFESNTLVFEVEMELLVLLIACSGTRVRIFHCDTPEARHFQSTYQKAYERGCEDNSSYWHRLAIDESFDVEFVKSERWLEYPQVVILSQNAGELKHCPCCMLLELRRLLEAWRDKWYFQRHHRYLRDRLGHRRYIQLVKKMIRKKVVVDGFDRVWLAYDYYRYVEDGP